MRRAAGWWWMGAPAMGVWCGALAPAAACLVDGVIVRSASACWRPRGWATGPVYSLRLASTATMNVRSDTNAARFEAAGAEVGIVARSPRSRVAFELSAVLARALSGANGLSLRPALQYELWREWDGDDDGWRTYARIAVPFARAAADVLRLAPGLGAEVRVYTRWSAYAEADVMVWPAVGRGQFLLRAGIARHF